MSSESQINPSSFAYTDFLQAYRGTVPFKVRNKDVIALYQAYIGGGGGGAGTGEIIDCGDRIGGVGLVDLGNRV